MFGFLKKLFSQSDRDRELNRLRAEYSQAMRKVREIQAGYDAAANNADTLGLWSKADNLSARLANSLDVRKPLRERSRHEAGNGPHMRGITLTLANDLVGTGPSLQILLEDEVVCDRIEKAWSAWADEVCLAQKLHTMALAKIVDGEGVAQIITNDLLDNSVRLDVQVLDCDLMSTPYQRMLKGDIAVDGIVFDQYGRPAAYHILNAHPSEQGWYGKDQGFREVAARNILHWYRIDRPQQARGIPELTPSLLTFGHIREYSAAVLQACRVAACISAIFHTKAGPSSDSFTSVSLSATDFEPGMILGAPDGYDVTQMKPEQPAATYDTYTQRKLAEACHAACIPYAIATGDFSKESYAGGRMGRQVYQSSINVQRQHCNSAVMNRIFAAWLAEATRVPGLLPDGVSAVAANIPHAWYYDPFEHIDETKAASAITTNLSNFTTTLAAECAKRKLDWRKVIAQRAREIELQKQLGVLILPPGTPPLDQTNTPADGGSDASQQTQAA